MVWLWYLFFMGCFAGAWKFRCSNIHDLVHTHSWHITVFDCLIILVLWSSLGLNTVFLTSLSLLIVSLHFHFSSFKHNFHFLYLTFSLNSLSLVLSLFHFTFSNYVTFSSHLWHTSLFLAAQSDWFYGVQVRRTLFFSPNKLFSPQPTNQPTNQPANQPCSP